MCGIHREQINRLYFSAFANSLCSHNSWFQKTRMIAHERNLLNHLAYIAEMPSLKQHFALQRWLFNEHFRENNFHSRIFCKMWKIFFNSKQNFCYVALMSHLVADLRNLPRENLPKLLISSHFQCLNFDISANHRWVVIWMVTPTSNSHHGNFILWALFFGL